MIDKSRKLGLVAAGAVLLLSVACSGEQPPKQTDAAQVTTEVDVVAIAPVAEQTTAAASGASEDTVELAEYETVTGHIRQFVEHWLRHAGEPHDAVDGRVQAQLSQRQYPGSGSRVIDSHRLDRGYRKLRTHEPCYEG